MLTFIFIGITLNLLLLTLNGYISGYDYDGISVKETYLFTIPYLAFLVFVFNGIIFLANKILTLLKR